MDNTADLGTRHVFQKYVHFIVFKQSIVMYCKRNESVTLFLVCKLLKYQCDIRNTSGKITCMNFTQISYYIILDDI